MILAIDPGPEKSAFVVLSEVDGIVDAAIDPNKHVLVRCGWELYSQVVIEEAESYYLPASRALLGTAFWTGRFFQASCAGGEIRRPSIWSGVHLITRKTVKAHLCGLTRVGDREIREELIHRFGPGKEKAVGTKKNPGPVYGIKKDLWAALALAVTFAETRTEVRNAHGRAD